ncbi:MAG: permease-like cell division protein FtsX [Bacteroidia bacterium]
MLGLYALFMLAGQLALEQARGRLEYRIHLYNALLPEQIQEILTWLRSQSLVRRAEYIPPEEAMESFKKVAGDDFVRAMEGFNPFPPTIRVIFYGDRVSSDSVLAFSKRVLEWELVKEVDYPRSLLEVLEKRSGNLRIVGLLIGALVTVISFLLIFNAVRLAIFARRLEIRTMELVGATRSFIQRPFLLMGVLQGMIGSVLAIVSLHAGLLLVDRFLLSLDFLVSDWRLPAVYGGLATFGTFMGYMASKLAIRRFLNQALERLI